MMLTRYLKHEGALGECPDWYPLLVAARYLGVPPWELAKQSKVWMDWALAASAAEALASKPPKS